MDTKEAIRRIKDHMVVHHMKESPHCEHITEALGMAINVLGAFEQVAWERNIALKQLEELGISLGQKFGCEHCRFKQMSSRNLWCDIFDKIMPEDGYCCFFEFDT